MKKTWKLVTQGGGDPADDVYPQNYMNEEITLARADLLAIPTTAGYK